MQILAPCGGRAVAMTDVPDPVFSAQTVGPGVGIEPDGGPQQVLAPADGQLLKLSPYAFILLVGGETGILVHVGINTVRLGGEGFELLAAEGDTVTAGTPIISWNPDAVNGPDMARTVVVAVMDQAPDSIDSPATGPVAPGDLLFVC